MDTEKFVELTKNLEKKRKGKKEDLEKLQKLFEHFHLLNRKYMDKEAFEKAKGSIASMAEAVTNTVQFLDSEITHLRSKRMKLPVDNVELGEMQRVQTRNELFLKEVLAQFPDE